MMRSFFVAAALVVFSLFPAQAESPRIWGSIGSQIDGAGAEAQARYIGAPFIWNLQPVVGISAGAKGTGWVGAGAAWTWRPEQDGFFLRLTTMVGVHKRGNGPNLGGPIQFRNALDIGLTSAGGVEFGLGVDHRSNAGLYRPNPGLNSVYLFASIPLQ